jgi:ADP-dependent NAD(P)H-hydrate dehydratase / NAD(P)H-hydrate epimerase
VRKVLTGKQVKEVDLQTIRRGNITSAELMEQAAKAFVKIFCRRYDDTHPVIVFCGPGNNGGDGLAISRLLLKKHYAVTTWYIHAAEYSHDFRVNLEKLLKTNKQRVKIIDGTGQLPVIKKNSILIDALFGTGLNKPVTGTAASVIEWMNEQDATRVAVDIPSGLTDALPFPQSPVVQSGVTITFQLPKQALMLEDNRDYINEFEIADIGLDEEAIAAQPCNTFFIESADIKKILKPVKRFDSKWSNGHAMLIAGSYEKTGSALLAATSCMRSGVGLLTVHTPRTAKDIFNIALPEAMIQPDVHENIITSVSIDGRYSAFGIGPGIGTDELTVQAFIGFIHACNKPVVIDADGLNIIAANKDLLSHLPEQCILTPHEKEFDRLTQNHITHYHRIETQRDFSVKYKCIVVLKSAYTTISDTEGNIFFNSTGNGGMAKAGSGDVLTGVVTAFLAKGYTVLDTALCAVYVHGMAGDVAARKPGKIPMKAGDITEHLPKVFKRLME